VDNPGRRVPVCGLKPPNVRPSCLGPFRAIVQKGVLVRLFVRDDRAEEHPDVEVIDEAGTVLARWRPPKGVSVIGQLDEPSPKV
jgi:hypothetical protein